MKDLDHKILNYGISAGIIILDFNFVILDVNDRFNDMTGLNQGELLGNSINAIQGLSKNDLIDKDDNTLFGHFYTVLVQKNRGSLPVEVCYFTQNNDSEKKTILFFKKATFENITKSNISIIEQIFDHTNEAIIVTDNQGYIQTVNKGFSHITGFQPDEAIGKTPAILNSGKQDKHFYRKFWKELIEKGCWQGEIWNKRKSGEIFPEWLIISSIRDKKGEISNYICQFSDITKRKKSEEEIHFYAYHDTLTSLPNRRLLFEQLDQLNEVSKNTPTYFAVLFCDLDRFKIINDTLGHEVGDALLISVSDRLIDKLRANDFIARVGGDEFIIVIEGKKSLKNLDKVCKQIISLFKNPFKTPHGEFTISLSIGASQFPHDSADIKELISFADVALYDVKKSGGNHYSFFNSQEKSRIKQRLALENKILKAIINQEFELWYQPQVNTLTNEVYGIECLLRWNHPEQGIISPDLFIPLAEANGTIRELGYFVLRTACHQLKQWRLSNLFTGIMAINVSLKQFERNDLYEQVRKTLLDEELPGNAIELEVTESLFTDNSNLHIPVLRELRSLGAKIAIDDFGTGYSSLNRLKELPIDNVKIDKCFIDHIEDSSEDSAIVDAIITLLKTFNVELIAEGIETQAQAEILNKLGCFNHQGYFYSKPLNATKFEQWLIDFNGNKT